MPIKKTSAKTVTNVVVEEIAVASASVEAVPAYEPTPAPAPVDVKKPFAEAPAAARAPVKEAPKDPAEYEWTELESFNVVLDGKPVIKDPVYTKPGEKPASFGVASVAKVSADGQKLMSKGQKPAGLHPTIVLPEIDFHYGIEKTQQTKYDEFAVKGEIDPNNPEHVVFAFNWATSVEPALIQLTFDDRAAFGALAKFTKPVDTEMSDAESEAVERLKLLTRDSVLSASDKADLALIHEKVLKVIRDYPIQWKPTLRLAKDKEKNEIIGGRMHFFANLFSFPEKPNKKKWETNFFIPAISLTEPVPLSTINKTALRGIATVRIDDIKRAVSDVGSKLTLTTMTITDMPPKKTFQPRESATAAKYAAKNADQAAALRKAYLDGLAAGQAAASAPAADFRFGAASTSGGAALAAGYTDEMDGMAQR